MKTAIAYLLSALLYISLAPHLNAAPADPGDKFLEAFLLIQAADTAERNSEWQTAHTKFKKSLELLREIQSSAPTWNPHIIEYRLGYCTERLGALAAKVPAETTAPVTQPVAEPPPPAPAPSPTPAPVEPPPPDNTELNNLKSQIQTLQDQLNKAEASRSELQAKLAEALAKVPATETNQRIEELLKQNNELATQLASAQQQITALKTAATPASAPVANPAELVQLRAQVATLQTELDQTKSELDKTRAELTLVRNELKSSNADLELVRTQLRESERKLLAAESSGKKNDEIITQLRKENALLQQIIDRRSTPTTNISPRRPAAESSRTLPELKGVRPRRSAGATETIPPSTESSPHQLTAEVTAPASPVEPAPAPPPAPVPSKITNLIKEGRDALASKQFDVATEKFNAVLAQDPKSVAALSSLGVLHYQQGQLADAEAVLIRAVAAAPNNSQACAMLGVVYLRRGQLDKAFSQLNRAVALDPKNAEAHNYLGITHSQKGWSTAAEQSIKRAIEVKPDYADAHFNLAVLYNRPPNARPDLARQHYRKALELGADRDPNLDKLLQAP
jgi:Flp pilus assembly protein TadD/cob(I)alamin adenosyltransferase